MPHAPDDPRPHSRATLRVRRDDVVDRVMHRAVISRSRARSGELDGLRIQGEVDKAVDLFEARGWLEDPATYHRSPTIPEGVRRSEARSGRLRYLRLTWPDGFEVDPDEPGAARFATYPKNRIARAAVLEHRSPRPWLVVVHGFGMGSPALDLRAFRASHLHRTVGCNVALITLPFHGRRNPNGGLEPGMPSADVLDTVHGLAQAVWDVRQLMALLRSESDQPVAVLGLSLGGLVASLVASLDDPHTVTAVVPAVDLPTLMADTASSAGAEGDAEAAELLSSSAALFRPLSPLVLEPRVPHERRLIVAGTLDRFARPSTQAIELWRHWDEPKIHWYHGGHVSVFWAKGVQDAIDAHVLPR